MWRSLNKIAFWIFFPQVTVEMNRSSLEIDPVYPCGICKREVNDNDDAIFCETGCAQWYHRVCTGLTELAYDLLTAEENAEWVCDNCIATKSIPLVKLKSWLVFFTKIAESIHTQVNDCKISKDKVLRLHVHILCTSVLILTCFFILIHVHLHIENPTNTWQTKPSLKSQIFLNLTQV